MLLYTLLLYLSISMNKKCRNRIKNSKTYNIYEKTYLKLEGLRWIIEMFISEKTEDMREGYFGIPKDQNENIMLFSAKRMMK